MKPPAEPSITVTARVPVSLAERLEKAAEAEDRPRSTVVRRAVARYLADEHREVSETA